MENIVQSFTIFVDTSRGSSINNEAEGDCFLLDLNDTNINTKTGQDIRLTLTNFSMYYVTTNINANNSIFQLRTNLTTNDVNRVDHSLDLSHKNYALIRDIGLDFANALKVALLNDLSAGLVTDIDISGLLPGTDAGIAGTSNNVISFDLVTKNTGGTLEAHGLQSLVIQFHEKDPFDRIAIGRSAASSNQQQYGISIGVLSGNSFQGEKAIAIGNNAGNIDQGTASIAIGSQAGVNDMCNNCIILNATDNVLDSVAGASSFYVKPIRYDTTNNIYIMTLHQEK